MASDDSFGDFELAGWEDEATAAEYDRQLSLVTIQSVEALLDDAGVERGHKVLDVATARDTWPLQLRNVGRILLASTSRQRKCAWREPGTRASALSKRTQKPCPLMPNRSKPLSTPSGSATFPILPSPFARPSAC